MAKKRKKEATPGELLVCSLPKATQRYTIEERIEAGLVLTGSEVKSMRQRRADLDGAYASMQGGELWLHKMHVAPYAQAGPFFGHEPRRSRKLLLRASELKRIAGRLTARGYTLVPLRVYFRDGWAKVEIGLGKGRKSGDRREEIRRATDLREARAEMGRRRGR